jgi:2-desacetyl-2-hydroxyethyl bacteriochlorophyllide A dehydrogenase
MKAAVFHGVRDIRLEERERRRPRRGEVSVRVKACGVCGTDVHMYHGAPGSAKTRPPVVLGHEMSGEVAEVGSGVDGLADGDRVTVDPNMSCGRCFYCRIGRTHLCESLRAVGVTQDGGFAEYCTVRASQVYRVRPAVSFEAAALAEPLACCLHGIDRAAIRAGRDVAVFGVGPIGLMAVQLAFLRGASRVFASDPREIRRKLAERFGARTYDPAKVDVVEAIRGEAHDGVDAAVECAGVPEAMTQAVRSVRRGGSVLLFSVAAPDAVLPLSPYEIYQRELTLTGSFINPGTHEWAVRLIEEGKVDLLPLVSHRFPLDRTVEALSCGSDAAGVKILVEP